MRAFVLTLMLLALLPLQWATAGSVGVHVQVQHQMQAQAHAQQAQHHAHAGAHQSTVEPTLGPFDIDCGICHVHALALMPGAFGAWVAPPSLRPQAVRENPRASPLRERPERPKWPTAPHVPVSSGPWAA